MSLVAIIAEVFSYPGSRLAAPPRATNSMASHTDEKWLSKNRIGRSVWNRPQQKEKCHHCGGSGKQLRL